MEVSMEGKIVKDIEIQVSGLINQNLPRIPAGKLLITTQPEDEHI